MKIHKLSFICLLLLPPFSYSADLDERQFAYLSYLTLSKQTEIYRSFCGQDEKLLKTFIEAENEFLKNSPQWLDIKNNPPENWAVIEKEDEKSSKEMELVLNNYLATAPLESTCITYSKMLKRVPFSKHLQMGWQQ